MVLLLAIKEGLVLELLLAVELTQLEVEAGHHDLLAHHSSICFPLLLTLFLPFLEEIRVGFEDGVFLNRQNTVGVSH